MIRVPPRSAGTLAAVLFAAAAGAGHVERAHPPAPEAHRPPPVAALPEARPADLLRTEFEAAIAPGLGDSTEARLERFLVAHPHSPWTWGSQLELGQLHYARGDYSAAREHFRRARGGALVEEASYWEGLSAFALGRPREARDAVLGLARARRGAPRQWDAAYLVALSWAQEGDRAQALMAYRALLALPAGGGEAAALFQAQKLAREMKEPDEADQWSRRLADRYPESPEAASVRADEKRAAAAAQAAREAAAGAAATGPGGAPSGEPARTAPAADKGGH